MNALLKVPDIAKILNLSESKVRALVYERKIPFRKIQHSIRFDPREIEAWIDKYRVNVPDGEERDGN